MVTLFTTSTVYTANELTLIRGTSADILEVLIYHNTDPNVVPAYAAMTAVQLVEAPDPLADGAKIDVLTKVGPGLAALVDPGEVTLAAGDWQRWVGIRTAAEFILASTDVVEVIGTPV